MKKTLKIGLISIITVLAILTSVSVFAARTVKILDDKITITDSETTGSGDASKYTATAKGSIISKKTNTITIANESGKDGVISFNYATTSANACTVAGTASTSGSYSNSITKDGTVVIVLTSNSGFSNTTATLTLTNITFQEMAESSDVTYIFDSSLGTVTAGGTAISSGSTVTVDAAGTQMVATASSGATFIGWVEEDGTIVSNSATYTQQAVGNKTITAVFSKGTPYFMVDEKYIFSDLNQAASAGTTVVLMCNGTLPAGNYTIPAGKTLLIPMDDANTLYTTQPGSQQVNSASASAYRTLTMANGANITVNGAISLAGIQSASIKYHGSVYGKYGHIAMNSGSTITVNNGGKLYTWGYITGSGSITAKSGATVYEHFQLRDWRGGDGTSSMLKNNERVFPMSQYYVQNIEVPLTLEAGAVENGFMSVYVTLAGIQSSEVPFIGPSGMFRIVSGSITKDYDENTDRLVIDIDGTIEMASLTLSMKITALGGNQTVNSSDYTLPVNGNITIHANNGSSINISQDMALLPGSEIFVYEGAKCTFASGTKAFIYDADQWKWVGEDGKEYGYCSPSNQIFMAANYAPGRKYTRTEADLKDAIVYVEGEVDASAAEVYTTASGANICGADGGLVRLQQGTATVTYQVTQNDTDITGYPEIPVTTAWLKNGDGTYVDPEKLGDCCTSYIYTNGVWVPNEVKHISEEVEIQGTEATCTQEGLTDKIVCLACNTVIQEQTGIPVDKSNHMWDEGVVTTQPTHTVEGVKTYTCTRCDDEKTEGIAKTTDHEWDEGVVTTQPTHTAEGVKTYTCTCGDTYTEEVAKKADHEWDEGVVTTQPTHMAEGVKTYTCTCGDTYTEEIAKKADHEYGEWEKVDGINHARKCVCEDVETKAHEFEGFACTLCGSDKIVTNTTYTIENGEIKINTELIWEVPEGTQIIIALYNADEKLINATIIAADELAEIAYASEGVAQIRVFAWSGFDLLKPISIPEEITLN